MLHEYEAGAVPPHLTEITALLTQPGGWETFASVIANSQESETEIIWQRIDFCAAGHLVFDFSKNKKLLGEVAGLIKRHKETVRRYVAVGMTFPPSLTIHNGRTGEVELVYFRLPDEAINLYIEAVKAQDPVQALLLAREHGWSAADLRKHIKSGGVPSSYRELAARKIASPFDAEQVLADFAVEVMEALHALREQGYSVDALRIHASVNVTEVGSAV